MNKFAIAKRHAELHRYHITSKFVVMPHNKAIFDWLDSELDKFDWAYYDTNTIYFRNEEDKVKFILKWI